ncbi:MAG: pyridoxamine 5'-phosphate oxidase family protein [Chitinophagaceae bacterium]|nr:pyridoxamine 5'-phosphate oxidase family protein [Chitinophagaceae bacterium]MCW5927476.1 pyridoxamine 5'-phosphate oxidase family protein [Chitinophagaceae bacterium]
MIGKLNSQEIEELLASQQLARLGCMHGKKVYIVPISYAYDGEYIYGRTREGMKIDFMRKHPDVCIEVENITSMAEWKTAIAWGKFEELNDAKLRSEALRKLSSRIIPGAASETLRFSDDWPFSPADINSIEGIVYRIKLDEKSGRFEHPNY